MKLTTRFHNQNAVSLNRLTCRLSVLVALLLSASFQQVHADTFGSGAKRFDIDFVTIGNPGNVADTTGNPNSAGAVAEVYRIGKYEVSEQMIEKANTLGSLGITKYTRGPNKPATSVSWNEAARFINWLNISSGSTPAYKFALQPGDVGYSANANIQLWTPADAGYNPNNLYRSSRARYFLPSAHEWYKAAYYDPMAGVYYDYPTGSNSPPIAVSSSTWAGAAVYGISFIPGPADITLAGGLSPYGTMGQGGNVWEWEETDFDLVNDSSSSARGVRGCSWDSDFSRMRAANRSFGNPTLEGRNIGFRVASVPEPSSLLLAALAATGLLWRRRVGNLIAPPCS